MGPLVHLLGHAAIHLGHKAFEDWERNQHHNEMTRKQQYSNPYYYRTEDIIIRGKGFILIKRPELYRPDMVY
jgi:hypothetical protein